MTGYQKRGLKPVLLMIFALLLTLALAVPAQADNTLQVEVENPTIYATSDYYLTFTTGSEISVGEAVYVNVCEDFDISGSIDDVQLDAGGVYSFEVNRINGNEFYVSVIDGQIAGEITITIPGIQNPSGVGTYCFANVTVKNIELIGNEVEILSPKLEIIPEQNTIKNMVA